MRVLEALPRIPRATLEDIAEATQKGNTAETPGKVLVELRKEVLECIWHIILGEIASVPGNITEDIHGGTSDGIPGGTSEENL